MANFAMTDVTTWAHGYDFTTDLNQVSLKAQVDDLERTTFGGGGYKGRAGGLHDVTLSLNGFWGSGASASPDSDGFGDLGAMNRVVTMSPTGVLGSVAYLSQLGKFKYEAFGSVGDMTPFSLDCSGSTKFGLVRGAVAAAKQAVTATGAIGAGTVLPAASSSQFVYASLHVFTAGTTITVKVESDDNSGFTSPTTVATFPAITAAGGNWMTRVSGPATDTFYRFNVTAVTGSFSLAGAIAVQ